MRTWTAWFFSNLGGIGQSRYITSSPGKGTYSPSMLEKDKAKMQNFANNYAEYSIAYQRQGFFISSIFPCCDTDKIVLIDKQCEDRPKNQGLLHIMCKVILS